MADNSFRRYADQRSAQGGPAAVDQFVCVAVAGYATMEGKEQCDLLPEYLGWCPVVGTFLHNDVVKNRPYYPLFELVPTNPVEGCDIFFLSVVEEDRFSPDDNLGTNRIQWNESDVWQFFDENNDDDPDLSAKVRW